MHNPDSSNSPLIEIKNINIRFNQKTITQNFNLEINKQDKVIITGESGLGKSSLLKVLMGFIIPSSGEIYYNGVTITNTNIWKFRQKIAYVSQDMDIGVGSVLSLIETIFTYKSNKNLGLDIQEAKQLLAQFSLPVDVLSTDYEKLSGGEKQRVQIVIAILLKRDIFFLDEATSALDRHMKQVVKDYFTNSNHTVIAVAHDDIWFESKNVRKVILKEEK
ncbi:MAG: hypothetical protein A2Y40_05690 [Candidatus Margulisbacteria bacterium GWF2_35_9]|nr:MAG: hypothetical protein A2Y40_05690 [Candidatus Margulisbacteria bacterium GWF2_35_9]